MTKETRIPKFNRRSLEERYPYHNFEGRFNRDKKGHITRPESFSSMLKDPAIRFFNRLRQEEKTINDLTENWDQIPSDSQVNPGDQIVIRQEGKISNLKQIIKSGGGIVIPFLIIYPSTVKSINYEQEEISSITTIFYQLGGNTDKKHSNLKPEINEVELTIPTADFRLLDTFQAYAKTQLGSTFMVEQ